MASIFDYQFNVGGNFTAAMEGMIESTGRFRAKVEDCNNWIGKMDSTLVVVDLARNAIEQADSVIKAFKVSGIALDSQMHDLSAVAGVVGDDLKTIEGYAKESANIF